MKFSKSQGKKQNIVGKFYNYIYFIEVYISIFKQKKNLPNLASPFKILNFVNYSTVVSVSPLKIPAISAK